MQNRFQLEWQAGAGTGAARTGLSSVGAGFHAISFCDYDLIVIRKICGKTIAHLPLERESLLAERRVVGLLVTAQHAARRPNPLRIPVRGQVGDTFAFSIGFQFNLIS